MKKLIVLLTACLVVLEERVSRAADSQFWNSYSGTKYITESWAIALEEELRLGEDMKKLTYYHTDLGFIHSTAHWLTLGVHYQFIRGWKEVLWETEHRPHVDATLRTQWKSLELSNRSRMEKRLLSDTKDLWRYRNKTTLAWVLECHKRQVKPYVSEEYFMDFDQRDFNYNRIAVGLEVELTKNATGNAYYLRQDQDDRGIEPKANVLGLAFDFDF